jgi:hypothetical protein
LQLEWCRWVSVLPDHCTGDPFSLFLSCPALFRLYWVLAFH